MRVFSLQVLIFVSVFTLVSCGSLQKQDSPPRHTPAHLVNVPDAIPKNEPRSDYGNPEKYSVFGKEYQTLPSAQGFRQSGYASWYGTKFHGKRTSSGEKYDMYAMTAAHKRLPLPSYVKVTNQENGKSVIVRVNDRGPFHDGRIIDLSYVAALKLDIVKNGTAPVEIEAIDVSHQQQVNQRDKILQVGAFSDIQNAEEVRIKLAQAAISSDIQRVIVNARKHMYRVQVGPISQQQQIEEMLQKLEKNGFSDVKVLTDNEIVR